MRHAGYQAPVPIAPVSEAAVLTAQISLLVPKLQDLMEQAQRLQQAHQQSGAQGGAV